MDSSASNAQAQWNLSTLLKRRRGNKTNSESSDMQDKDILDCLIARMFYSGGLSFNLAKNPYYLSSFAYACDMQDRDHLDCLIAKMFYSGGLSFNHLRNPYFMSAFAFAATLKLSGYVPPSFDELRATLLDQEKERIESALAPTKTACWQRGATIVSDGWSDPQRRPFINFMVVVGNRTMFIKSVNCVGEEKDKFFIRDLMKEIVDELGHQNVVQIITDVSSNSKGAGELIEGIYPHIYWTPGVVHALNLALTDICDAKNVESNQETFDLCHWITEVHATIMQIKNFILNHNLRLTMYLKLTPLKLLSTPDKRFASMVTMMKRFKRIRRALEAMVISEDWPLYKGDDPVKAQFVKGTIVNDAWWDKLAYIIDFTAPIYDMIRVCDTNKSCLHLVYEMWGSTIKKVKKVIYKHEGKSLGELSRFYEVVHDILVNRWEESNIPLHCLAHSLNPRFHSASWLSEDPTRVAPHKDAKVSSGRDKCFRRLFPNVDHYKKAISEFAKFALKSEPFFHDEVCIATMDSENPTDWWVNYGSSMPSLQGLAIKLLAQPASSSCCERNWSTYSFIDAMSKNGLTSKRAEDLVFVHNNLRLISRYAEEHMNPNPNSNSKMWDVGGDGFGSLEDTGILEIAELSLDEPEYEEELISAEG